MAFSFYHLPDSSIDSAFVWAHQADPTAKLYYNEYFYAGPEYGGTRMPYKIDFTYEVVQGLLERGVPIDGIGFQSHLCTETFPGKEVFAADVKRFTDLGIKVYISELDIRLVKEITPDTLQRQGEIFQDVMEVVLENDHCNSLTFWGFNDQQTFSVDGLGKYYAPTLMDSTYLPKPTWYGIRKALKQ